MLTISREDALKVREALALADRNSDVCVCLAGETCKYCQRIQDGFAILDAALAQPERLEWRVAGDLLCFGQWIPMDWEPEETRDDAEKKKDLLEARTRFRNLHIQCRTAGTPAGEWRKADEAGREG
jgi:hypothetical protein